MKEKAGKPDDCCNNELPLVLFIPNQLHPALSLEWELCFAEMIASRAGSLARLFILSRTAYANHEIVAREHEVFIMMQDGQGWRRGRGRVGFLHCSAGG